MLEIHERERAEFDKTRLDPVRVWGQVLDVRIISGCFPCSKKKRSFQRPKTGFEILAMSFDHWVVEEIGRREARPEQIEVWSRAHPQMTDRDADPGPVRHSPGDEARRLFSFSLFLFLLFEGGDFASKLMFTVLWCDMN